MTTVQNVLQFIETIAPPYMKEHWDKVGLNCGRLDKPVKKILVALERAYWASLPRCVLFYSFYQSVD